MTGALTGTVREFPLDALLRLLADTKKTGELQLRAGDRVGALGLAEGKVVTAVFGEEPPLVSLSELFSLEAADFEFTPWDEAPPKNLEGELDDLLKKAAEHKSWLASVREVIPSDRVRFRLSERAADQGAVTFTADRWRIVLAVNGERNVAALADTLHIDHDTALTALANLVRDGVIETVMPPEPAVAPQPEPAPAPEPPMSAAPPVWESPPTQPEPVFEPAPPSEPPLSFDATPTFETAPPATPEPPVAQDWGLAEPAAPSYEPTAPEPVAAAPEPPAEPAPEPPSADDRLATLTGIFGTAPASPPEPVQPAADQWSAPAPAADQWSAPAPDEAPAAPADEWSAPAPAADAWSTPPAPADQWTAPASADDTWSAPATSEDQWSAPIADDPRLAAFTPPAAPAMPTREAPEVPVADEWGTPPTQVTPIPEKKRGGLFGFGRKDKTQRAVPAGAVAIGPVSRPAMLGALSNALISEYNSGSYGKARIETRLTTLLMRVDEQADPIDRPLPIVDDRIDVQALDRDRAPADQLAPYLALLVNTIYSDAEKAFGKDKAKRGYRAAMVSALGSDSVALATPELAGKLPKV